MLCDAMRCQLEDGNVSANGIALAPDRFWNSTMASMIAADNAGPCLGIGLNIWERAKVGIHFIFYMFYMNYMNYMNYIHYLQCIV